MVFKTIPIFALLGVATASQWSAEPTLVKTIEEYDSHPEYTFTYGVEDSISGDSKSQTETRNGDVVHGEYSLNDADGYRRTVKYTADSLSGFNAVVDRKPFVEAAPVSVKIVEHIEAPAAIKSVEHVPAPLFVKSVEHLPAPALVKTAAPITYTTPTLIKSIPITYSSPTLIKSVPIHYTAPNQIKSVPSSYLAKISFEPTLVYSSGPAIHKSVHLADSAQTLVKSTPFTYAGQMGYSKSFPVVSQW